MVVVRTSSYLCTIGSDFGSVFVRSIPPGRNHLVLAVGGGRFEVDDTLKVKHIRYQTLQNTSCFSQRGQKRADTNMLQALLLPFWQQDQAYDNQRTIERSPLC